MSINAAIVTIVYLMHVFDVKLLIFLDYSINLPGLAGLCSTVCEEKAHVLGFLIVNTHFVLPSTSVLIKNESHQNY